MLIDNHLEIIAILYIIFAVITITSVATNVARSHRISIMHMCNVMYILLLCVIPALILLGYTNGLRVTNIIVFTESAVWTFYLQLVLTVIGYLLFQFGYKIKQKKVETYAVLPEKNSLLISVIFSVVSAVSLYLWASGYGGIGGLILNANQIRAGWISSTNSFAFFKHFVPVSLLASWMLFNKIIRKETKTGFAKVGVYTLFLCNISLSSIYIQANDGRMLLAVYVFLFFVIYLKSQYEIKKENISSLILKFGAVFVFVIAVLLNADSILHMMRDGVRVSSNNSSIVGTLSKEFSFIIAGTQKALMQSVSGDGEFMIVNDVVNGVFAWLPTSLKPIILEDVWNYNTRLVNTGGYGQSPTTIVAQSIYDIGLLGIVIFPFLYGILVKKIEIVLEKRKGNTFYDTIYVALGYYLCKGIPYFSLYNIMINTFFIFIAILIYSTLKKIKLW